MKAAFACPVVQGYGLTETAAGATVSDFDDPEFGHVGPPVECCEIKLVDVPEMDYLTSNKPQCGEIWIRGPAIALGYYKDEQQTRESFDADGWFHTGDIGRWNPNGTLSIIDRKKNIFKVNSKKSVFVCLLVVAESLLCCVQLSQGEYVAAEKLELVYGRSRFVAQMMIYGDSLQSSVIAIVRPEPEFVGKWAHECKLPSTKVEDLVKVKSQRTLSSVDKHL
jgi:long-chain acyl-CoA synthetase